MTSILLVALLAAPKTVSPAATLQLGKRQLHTWSWCAVKSSVAAMVGTELVLGRLDAAKKKVSMSPPAKVDSWAMAFSSDCSLLVASQTIADGEKRTHSFSTFRVTDGKLTPLAQLGPFPTPIRAIAISEDDAWLIVAGNKTLTTWRLDPKTGAAKQAFETPALPGDDLYMQVRLRRGIVLAGTYEGKVQLKGFEPADGRLSSGTDLMQPTVATRTEGSLNTDTGAIVMPGGARVFDVAFSNEGKRAWAVVESGQVFAWDVEKPASARVTVVDGLDGANVMAVSPDGTRLAAGGNYSAQVWKLDGFKAAPLGELGGLVHVDKYVSTDAMHWLDAKHLGVGTGDLYSAKLVVYAPP